MSVPMPEPYQIEKWIWTEGDFERMGWHDCLVHALAFSPETFELSLDIDYILDWPHSALGSTGSGFWTAPATMVFENMYDAEFDIGSYSGGLEISGIKREDARSPRNARYIRHDTEWLWTVDCQEGDIKLRPDTPSTSVPRRSLADRNSGCRRAAAALL